MARPRHANLRERHVNLITRRFNIALKRARARIQTERNGPRAINHENFYPSPPPPPAPRRRCLLVSLAGLLFLIRSRAGRATADVLRFIYRIYRSTLRRLSIYDTRDNAAR